MSRLESAIRLIKSVGNEFHEDLQLANHLLKQHPQSYTRGAWYPATTPDGQSVEIRRAAGQGQSKDLFLHVRKKVPHSIKDPSGKITQMPHTYLHKRINMRTGRVQEV